MSIVSGNPVGTPVNPQTGGALPVNALIDDGGITRLAVDVAGPEQTTAEEFLSMMLDEMRAVRLGIEMLINQGNLEHVDLIELSRGLRDQHAYETEE